MSQAATNIFAALPVNVLDPVTPGAQAQIAQAQRTSADIRGQNVQSQIANRGFDIRLKEIDMQEKQAQLAAKADALNLQITASLKRQALEQEKSLAEQQMAQQQEQFSQEQERLTKQSEGAQQLQKEELELKRTTDAADAKIKQKSMELMEADAAYERSIREAEYNSAKQYQDQIRAKRMELADLSARSMILNHTVENGYASTVATLDVMQGQLEGMAQMEEEQTVQANKVAETIVDEVQSRAQRGAMGAGLGEAVSRGLAGLGAAVEGWVAGTEMSPEPAEATPGTPLGSRVAQEALPFDSVWGAIYLPSQAERPEWVGGSQIGVVPDMLDRMEGSEESKALASEFSQLLYAKVYDRQVGYLTAKDTARLDERIQEVGDELRQNPEAAQLAEMVRKGLDTIGMSALAGAGETAPEGVRAMRGPKEDLRLLGQIYGQMSREADKYVGEQMNGTTLQSMRDMRTRMLQAVQNGSMGDREAVLLEIDKTLRRFRDQNQGVVPEAVVKSMAELAEAANQIQGARREAQQIEVKTRSIESWMDLMQADVAGEAASAKAEIERQFSVREKEIFATLRDLGADVGGE